jgi:toxin ParE1/3/4
MPDYILTNQAVRDLNGIWLYTADNWSEKQADKYYSGLLDRCRFIADSPLLGKSYEAILSGLLGFKTNRHIIFYRVSGNEQIEIIRILHERMDLEENLST